MWRFYTLKKLLQRFFNQRISKTGSLIVLLLLLSSRIYAQQAEDYSIHANIIYHFTKYIDWPENKKAGDFIIGVTGDSPLFDELKKCTVNKTAGSQKIVIQKIPSSATSYSCHILFVSGEESGSLKKIVSRIEGSPVLLLTEFPGFARKGAGINFKIMGERLKLEINKTSIEQRELGIASELLRLGEIVN
jgi:hypothetical protein